MERNTVTCSSSAALRRPSRRSTGKIGNSRNKPIWILQGDQDSPALLEGSRVFYTVLQELGNERARYHEFMAEEKGMRQAPDTRKKAGD